MDFLQRLLRVVQDGGPASVQPQNNELNVNPQGFGYVNGRGLSVQGALPSNRLQPSGPSYEDQVTNMQSMQPAQIDNRLQGVQRNGNFLQGLSAQGGQIRVPQPRSTALSLPADFAQYGMPGLELQQRAQMRQLDRQELPYINYYGQ